VVLLPSNSAHSYANADARVSQRHDMYWRDGVHLWRRDVCRELFTRLLLRLLATNAYSHSDAHTHTYPDTNTHTYAISDSNADSAG
jgi:hypothetical protein